MFEWIKAKAQKKIVDTLRDEIERFIISLRGAGAEEVAAILLSATMMRLYLVEISVLDPDTLSLQTLKSTIEHDTQALHLNRAIRDFQGREEFDCAVGVMVWLHTVRALQNPEIRLLGRSLWKELERGQSEISQNEDQYLRTNSELSASQLAEYKYVPDGLEPEVR